MQTIATALNGRRKGVGGVVGRVVTSSPGYSLPSSWSTGPVLFYPMVRSDRLIIGRFQIVQRVKRHFSRCFERLRMLLIQARSCATA